MFAVALVALAHATWPPVLKHRPSSRLLQRMRPLLRMATATPSLEIGATPADTKDIWAGWPRTWVPLASSFELDPERPTPVRFLGRTFVLWQDNEATWRVFEDACPHRLAPLSEGRIDRATGTLECAYHGWQFTAAGSCAKIPQIAAEKHRAACTSTRACARVFPVQVEKCVIFFWPWGGVPADASGPLGDSALPHHQLSSVLPGASTYTRDLPYGWDTLLENIVDPSHVPFAHHGLQGKREDAIAINMSAAIAMHPSGFNFSFGDRTMGMRRAGGGEFRAPYVVSYAAVFEPKPAAPPPPPGMPPKCFNLTVVMIPVAPGWSRAIIFGGPSGNKAPKPAVVKEGNGADEGQAPPEKKRASLISIIFSLLPVWLTHLLSSRFLDTDLAFLHYQEQELQRRQKLDYFMPAAADRPIAAMRKWVQQYTPPLGQLPPPILERSRLLDRWTQHGSHCVHCTRAVESIGLWKRRLSLMLVLSLLGSHLPLLRVLGATCAGLLILLQGLERQFQWQDFKHWRNH
mmetsp:Transcript_75392/g.125702  ORF Transcript_75392/g.125702 Transcript_75392/m.125702 type:complete len:518 (-) Transcript_75392:38-1591(-)